MKREKHYPDKTQCQRKKVRMIDVIKVDLNKIKFDPSKSNMSVEELKKTGYKVLSVEQVEHSTKLQTFEPQRALKYAIVLGNEVKGVRQEVVDASDGCLEIPQLGTKHSMNVSVTAGIIIYKFAESLILK